MLIRTIVATDLPASPPLFIQDPLAIRGYQIEWAGVLEAASDLPIGTATWTVTGSAGTLGASGQYTDATRSVVTLTGGTPGVTYRVTCRMTTAYGDREERSFLVRIQDT